MSRDRSYAELAADALRRALEADGLERNSLLGEALRLHRLAVQSEHPQWLDGDEPVD